MLREIRLLCDQITQILTLCLFIQLSRNLEAFDGNNMLVCRYRKTNTVKPTGTLFVCLCLFQFYSNKNLKQHYEYKLHWDSQPVANNIPAGNVNSSVSVRLLRSALCTHSHVFSLSYICSNSYKSEKRLLMETSSDNVTIIICFILL